jgi:hypothetical protein
MATTKFPGGVKLGDDGTAITQMRVYTVTFNPASVAAATSAEQDVTVTGVTTADKIIVNAPALIAGVGIVNARAKAADTVALTFMNATAGAVDPASGSYTFLAIRS